MKHPIATIPRYLYLNFWAFILLFSGIGLAFLPIYKWGVAAIVSQVVAVLFIERGAINIFHTWGDKKRKYTVLVERNSAGLRPDTFDEYMAAPCGRLLVKVVLHDIGLSCKYKELRKRRRGFWTCKKENFRRQTVRVYINPKYSDSARSDK